VKLLVTGGSGFLGSAFVQAATARGHQIGMLSRTGRDPRDPQVSVLSGSLADPPWAEIARFAPEACLHAAWIATPGVYLESPENGDWVRWSLEFLHRLPALGVRHLVALGTCIEYQITGQPLREDATTLAPASTYARSKCELHERLRASPSLTDATLAWARIFYPYGNGEHPARLASSLLSRLDRGEEVMLRTPHSVKDYIHADDVATALLSVVERRFNGAINIGTGEGVTIETIARRLAASVGRPELVKVPEKPVADPLDFVVADAGRLHSLGWRPQVTLAAGLQRLVDARRP
jgi:nucleoside-diphosphate-sugar epimerase